MQQYHRSSRHCSYSEAISLACKHFLKEECVSLHTLDSPSCFVTGILLGHGSSGKVYMGYQQWYDTDAERNSAPSPPLWRRIAVKEIALSTESNGVSFFTAIRQHLQEHRLASQIQSPHVVPMYHPWYSKTRRALMLPMQRGDCTLEYYASMVFQFEYPPGVLQSITLQCVQALVDVHEKGIVHRDVKPTNFIVFLEADTVLGSSGSIQTNHSNTRSDAAKHAAYEALHSACIKLSDFGLSAPVESTAALYTGVGTRYFMAPECDVASRLSEGPRQARDMWSLGCIFYWLLAKMLPFRGATCAAVAEAAAAGLTQKDVTTLLNRSRSPEARCLLPMVLKMLSVDPTQRPTAADLLAHLRVAFSAAHSASQNPPVTRLVPEVARRYRRLRVSSGSLQLSVFNCPIHSPEKQLGIILNHGDCIMAESEEFCIVAGARRSLAAMATLALSSRSDADQAVVWVKVVYPVEGYMVRSYSLKGAALLCDFGTTSNPIVVAAAPPATILTVSSSPNIAPTSLMNGTQESSSSPSKSTTHTAAAAVGDHSSGSGSDTNAALMKGGMDSGSYGAIFAKMSCDRHGSEHRFFRANTEPAPATEVTATPVREAKQQRSLNSLRSTQNTAVVLKDSCRNVALDPSVRFFPNGEAITFYAAASGFIKALPALRGASVAVKMSQKKKSLALKKWTPLNTTVRSSV